MIYGKISEDKRYIILDCDNPIEIMKIRPYFIKKIPNWYILKKKNININVDESFINDYNMIPIGLWVELANVCKNASVDIKFDDGFNSCVSDTTISMDSFRSYVMEMLSNSKMEARDYQIEAAFNVLKYKNCCIEVSTSGGKTFISYLIFRYMIDKLGVKKILFVTPKTNLTTQSASKFALYDKENGIETNWTYSEIHGSVKKKSEYNDTIIFGNYQSLCKKPAEFFKDFDVVIEDECHHSKSKSLKKITRMCCNAKYKIGMTGTFPKDGTYESFVLQSYLGPVVYRLTQYNLINKQNSATPIHVVSFELRYLPSDKLEALHNLRLARDEKDVTYGAEIYQEEKNQARKNELRFNYICDMIKSTTKNTLVIFSDIKDGYGMRVYNEIHENSTKNVYYIDGNIPPKTRNAIKDAMESDTTGNTIIVASMGCFSEGIDIANLWNIFLIESTKSDNTISQILGRGMRMYEGKDKTMMIDFVDDFRYGHGKYENNYLYKHGKERQNIYRNKGFPLNVFSVKLDSNSVFLVDK